jgi:hypothetical protein
MTTAYRILQAPEERWLVAIDSWLGTRAVWSEFIISLSLFLVLALSRHGPALTAEACRSSDSLCRRPHRVRVSGLCRSPS